LANNVIDKGLRAFHPPRLATNLINSRFVPAVSPVDLHIRMTDTATFKRAVIDYICGCFAGGANVLTGFPFDTVKVTLQARPEHRSAIACARHLYRIGGVRCTSNHFLFPGRLVQHAAGHQHASICHVTPC
jgi:Mitochondrial carrier protein